MWWWLLKNSDDPVKKYFRVGNKMVAAVIVLMTVLAVFLPVLDLNTRFQDYLVHFLIFLLFSGITGLIISNKIVLYTSFGCAAALALFLKNASNVELKDPAINQNERITVAHLNLSVVTGMDDIMRMLGDSTVDAISFQEYTPDWAAIIPAVSKKSFPYQITDVRMDLYGKCIISRFPLTQIDTSKSDEKPVLTAKIWKNKTAFTLASVYMLPALDNTSKAIASRQLTNLEETVGKYRDHLIVMGEFNQVYWSHDILGFRNRTNLLNSRRSVLPATLKMPYDHIFYLPDLECYLFEEITDTEGNHIGSRGSFQVRKK